jgi:ectoine hydroxylase-related dioxygenase (phytanoyl-CoA dioxygenase family)
METLTFDLARPFAISSEQWLAYRRDGHIVLQGVASVEELEYFRPFIIEIVEEVERSQDRERRLKDTRLLFTQVTNVWLKNDALREFIFAERFARIAADLMGVDGVRLYHDQAHIKEPGAKASPWHKDHYYWPLATHHTIKMWLALNDIALNMGAMRYATGSHRGGRFPEVHISHDSQALFDQIIHDRAIPTPIYHLNAGDAIFHSGEVLNSAGENTSEARREVIAIIYYADGTRVLAPDHEHRRLDMEDFLPGLRPGELAASDLNPLLYHRPG